MTVIELYVKGTGKSKNKSTQGYFQLFTDSESGAKYFQNSHTHRNVKIIEEDVGI